MLFAISLSGAGFVLGLLILISLVALGLWVMYWAACGFKATSPTVYRRRKSLLAWIGSVGMIMVCFPPMRCIGHWTSEQADASAPPQVAAEYDRVEFGYLPSYRWIGECGQPLEDLTPTSLSVLDHGKYQYTSAHWIIDSFYAGVQLIALLVTAVSIWRSRPSQDHTRQTVSDKVIIAT